MADLLNIGLSGLSAAKTNLSVTGHNITNINTPGFTRQNTVQAAQTPQFSGAGYVGSGTTLTDIRRSYSEFLTTQLRSSTALNSDVIAYKSQVEQLDSLLAGSSTGVTPSLQAFFSATHVAAEDPANIAARQLVLAEAEGLSRRFNNIHDNISSQGRFINKQLATSTEQINHLAHTVGSLNLAITGLGGQSQQANDLLDARDEAVRQLSTYVGVTVVVQDDNSFNVSVGSGQPLVVGGTVNQLQAVPGSGDPNAYDIDFVSGSSRQTITASISGGEVGGLLRYREDVLDPTLNALGRLAMSITTEVNSQLKQGLDLKGQVGADLFNNINDSTIAALRVRAVAGNPSNASGELHITQTTLLTSSDYRLDFDGKNYSARRLSDGAEIKVSPDPQSGVLSFTDSDNGRDQGFTLDMKEQPTAGDRFVLQPTRRGAMDIHTVLAHADQLAFAAPFKADADLQNKGNGVISQPTLQGVFSVAPAAVKPASAALLSDAEAELPADTPDEPQRLPDSLEAQALTLENLKNMGTLNLTYTAGALTFSGLPEGVRITGVAEAGAEVPQPITDGLTVKSGDINSLRYAIEFDLPNGAKHSYTIQHTLSGQLHDGDTFTVNFNQNGVSDNRNALQLAELQNKHVIGVDNSIKGMKTGLSFNDGYGGVVERVGTLTAQARQDDVATGAILKQSADSRNSLSAVNLDEEAAHLIQFEQYYNASAQVIQVARSLFDTLLNAFR